MDVCLAAGFLSSRTARGTVGKRVGGAVKEAEEEVDSGKTEAISLVSKGTECFGRVGVFFATGFLSSGASGLSFLESCKRESC
jgi:hypothetical protein